jgi:hypothetical protein
MVARVQAGCLNEAGVCQLSMDHVWHGLKVSSWRHEEKQSIQLHSSRELTWTAPHIIRQALSTCRWHAGFCMHSVSCSTHCTQLKAVSQAGSHSIVPPKVISDEAFQGSLTPPSIFFYQRPGCPASLPLRLGCCLGNRTSHEHLQACG